MSDIDLAIKRSKRIEQILRKEFKASGKGLHELLSSVERNLPRDLVRDIRLVATVRNKLVHDAEYTRIDDKQRFIAAADDAESGLRKLRPKASRGCLPAMLVMMVVMLGSVVKLVSTL